MAARVFTVFAAAFLVAAIAVAALTPVGFSLGEGVALASGTLVPWLEGHSPAWLMTWVEQPLMVRPLWLVPLALGIICAGVAASLPGTASPSRRRS